MTERDRRTRTGAISSKNKATSSSLTRASTIACLSCRSRKIRCEQNNDASPDRRCKHCLLTDNICQFQHHQRGKALDGRVDLRKHRKRKMKSNIGGGKGIGQERGEIERSETATGRSESGTSSPSVSNTAIEHGEVGFRPTIQHHHNQSFTQTQLTPDSSSLTRNNIIRHVPPSLSIPPIGDNPLFNHASPPVPRPRPSQVLSETFINTEPLEDQNFEDKNLRGAGIYSADRSPHPPRNDEEDEEDEEAQQASQFNIAPHIHSDALANGVISWDRLESIFLWYTRRVDPHAGLLDPDLHTPGYTRQYYPLFFSAITTMSAMARQDPEYPELAKIHEGLDAFATLSGYLCLDRVLARIAMLLWGIGESKMAKKGKRGGEHNRLHRIHQVLLDAIDLGLHQLPPHTSTNTGSSIQQGKEEQRWRERGSQSRTWIQLCLIYQTYRSDMIQQTDGILGQSIPTCESFLTNLSPSHITVADYRLAASLEIVAARCKVIQAARMLQPQGTLNAPQKLIEYGNELAKLHQRMSDIFHKWFIRDEQGEVFPRGRLDNLTSQDIYCTIETTFFYLNQVTWLWASSVAECGNTSSDNLRMGINAIVNVVEESPSSNISSQSVPALSTDELYWFSKTKAAALQVLTNIQKMKDEELTLSQDFVYVCASKIILWLSRYQNWFSLSFLYEVKRTMSDLSKRCMAATSRRGNTLRCFARLMNSVIQGLPIALDEANHHQEQNFQLSFSSSIPFTSSSNSSSNNNDNSRESQSAPIPTMSMEADAGILRSLPNTSAATTRLAYDHLATPFPSNTTITTSTATNWHPHRHDNSDDNATAYSSSTAYVSSSPPIDLGHFLDVEDLRHWEELLGLDLQLGSC